MTSLSVQHLDESRRSVVGTIFPPRGKVISGYLSTREERSGRLLREAVVDLFVGPDKNVIFIGRGIGTRYPAMIGHAEMFKDPRVFDPRALQLD
jgi:hypothetical protein